MMVVFASAAFFGDAAEENELLVFGGRNTTGSRIESEDTAPLPAVVAGSAEKLQMGLGNSLEQQAAALIYTQKYGTAVNDSLTGITTDSLGNVYIAGNSVSANASGFLRKYSSAGVLLWDRTKSTTSIDGVSLDTNGNAYIVGSFVSGAGSSTRHYIYLEKFDTDGNLLWSKSIAAAPASDPTFMIANAVTTNTNGKNFIVILYERAYWPYQTREVFIRKYNASGMPIWEKSVGYSSPYTARPILASDHNDNNYTAINTATNQQWNTTIKRFDAQGDPVWSTSFYPTATGLETYVHGIAADPNGNVYVTGITKANLEGQNLGYFDAFVRKYDSSSSTLWTRQFGTSANDYANSLTTDAIGNVYVVGSSMGDLKGRNRGSFDAMIRKYGGNGDVLQTKQFGSPEYDIANGLRIDVSGNLYVAGHTFGRFGAAKEGAQDVYFRKYSSF